MEADRSFLTSSTVGGGVASVNPVGKAAPLINLREFRAQARELLQEEQVLPGLEGPVDISSDEVKRVTPFERIEDALEQAVVRSRCLSLGPLSDRSPLETTRGSRRNSSYPAGLCCYRNAVVRGSQLSI